MKKILILPLICLTFTSYVKAESTPIDEMFSVMEIDKQMTGGFEAMLPVVDQMSQQFKLDQAGKEELKEIFRTWFNEDIDRVKIVNQVKAQYSQTFTDQEIKEITKFYKTPTGKKFLQESPKLMQLGAQAGMQEAQSKQVKLMERVKPFLDKHGIEQ